MYVKELKVRYRLRRVRGSAPECGQLSTPADAARYFMPILRQEVVEVCGLVCLSTKNHVLAFHELSRGTLDSTLVHPRDVFRTALLANAGSIVIGHNHPSGDISPSPGDRALTARLKHAAGVIGIDLVDHVIVSVDGRYFSFRESGCL